MRTMILAAAAVVATLALACGAPSGGQTTSAAPSPIAHIHHAKCGSCHMRVEPGERTRAELEKALARHRSRVHLTEEQWGQMVDYLAARDDAGAAPSP